MEAARLTFRIAVWRPWLLALSPGALVVALGAGVFLAAGVPVVAAGILACFAAVAVLVLLPIGIAVRVSRWHVSPEGIGGRNNYLIYRHLNWTEIESVEAWMIPGHRYVQVNGGGRRRAFWLPLFLTDMPGLCSAVRRYAPPDNPLRRFLEARLPDPGAAVDRGGM